MSDQNAAAVNPKGREVTLLNGTLALLAVVSVGLAAWTLVDNGLRAGVDDLFMILTCLTLAAIFSIGPLLYAKERGWILQPIVDEPAHEEEDDHAHGSSNKQTLLVWGGLLFLTAIEVVLAYIHLQA